MLNHWRRLALPALLLLALPIMSTAQGIDVAVTVAKAAPPAERKLAAAPVEHKAPAEPGEHKDKP